MIGRAVAGRDEPGIGSGERTARISKAVAKVHHDRYGERPINARTYMLGGLIVCVLEGGALTLEKTLHDSGQGEVADKMRRALEDSLDDELCSSIEHETNRSVRAHLSQFDAEHDLGVEVFFLR